MLTVILNNIYAMSKIQISIEHVIKSNSMWQFEIITPMKCYYQHVKQISIDLLQCKYRHQ